MEIREYKKITIRFELSDRRLIDRLIRKQVGDRKISWILDNCSYVFGWYAGLFSLISKMRSEQYVTLDSDEYSAIAELISKAYNDPDETEKDAIKKIADAIDAQRNWY